MALVEYDNSDSSEFEDEQVQFSSTKSEEVTETNGLTESDKSDNLFGYLPQPTSKKVTVAEEDDEYLHKKETVPNVMKPKAKIMVPSLNDFKDVKDIVTNPKSKLPNQKKSGLLSLLPQPKNYVSISVTTKSLIPHVISQKGTKANKQIPSPSVVKQTNEKNKGLTMNYSDDSDNDEVQNDFFSINTTHLPEDMPLNVEPVQINNETKLNVEKEKRNIESYFKQESIEHRETGEHFGGSTGGTEYDKLEASSSQISSGTSDTDGQIILDDEAILKLCGARGKRKREDIQIVDVDQKKVLADAREWLIKGLMDDTSQRVSASKKRGNEPTSQQKRKHQITYLAHQAKANEIELQNQWANNRMSKRQTQSKYGF